MYADVRGTDGSPTQYMRQTNTNESNSERGTSSSRSVWDTDEDDGHTERRRRGGAGLCCFDCKTCVIGLLIGMLLAGIALAVILTMWLAPTSSSQMKTVAHASTMSGNTTTTTATSTTTSTSTSTSTATSTSSSTSSSTSTSTSTTTSTATTTTSTTTSTTTTGCTSCSNYCWNQTGVPVAETSTRGISNPRSIAINANNIIYLAGHHAGSLDQCLSNATNRTVFTTNSIDHSDYITLDKNGSVYINDHDNNIVLRFSPDTAAMTIVAGAGSPVSGNLSHPAGTAVDDDFNLYIADQQNNQVKKLAANSSSLAVVINTAAVISRMSALLLPRSLPNHIYISNENGQKVYLWQFGAAAPSVTYTNVASGASSLKNPRGMKQDPLGNLYVADNDNERIVMFCANSTIGRVVLTTSDKPMDIAFDSNMNLYALLDNGKAMKYQLL